MHWAAAVQAASAAHAICDGQQLLATQASHCDGPSAPHVSVPQMLLLHVSEQQSDAKVHGCPSSLHVALHGAVVGQHVFITQCC